MKKKSKKVERYELVLTKKQAVLIQDALEAVSRLLSGQTCFLRDIWMQRVFQKGFSCEKFDEATKLLKEAVFPELVSNSFHGIFGDDTDPDAKDAWDMVQVIRHRLAWDDAGNPEERDWTNMMGVQYDSPMFAGLEPPCRIRRMADENGAGERVADRGLGLLRDRGGEHGMGLEEARRIIRMVDGAECYTEDQGVPKAAGNHGKGRIRGRKKAQGKSRKG